MSLNDYEDWIHRHTRSKSPRGPAVHRRPLAEEAPREEPYRPAEPIEVQEHHASTTIIERLYAVIGKRR